MSTGVLIQPVIGQAVLAVVVGIVVLKLPRPVYKEDGSGRDTLCGLPDNRHAPSLTPPTSFIMVTTSPTSQAVQNYADALQMNSFGLPVVFAAIYFLLLGAFLYKASKNPTYVLWVTAFFCLGRSIVKCDLATVTDGTHSSSAHCGIRDEGGSGEG